VLILRQVIVKVCDYNIELDILFIDFKQAIYSIRHKVIKLLQLKGIPSKLIRLISMTLELSSKSSSREQHGTTF